MLRLASAVCRSAGRGATDGESRRIVEGFAQDGPQQGVLFVARVCSGAVSLSTLGSLHEFRLASHLQRTNPNCQCQHEAVDSSPRLGEAW